jgi:glycosyltransferase involved in cell wall biosynthesis
MSGAFENVRGGEAGARLPKVSVVTPLYNSAAFVGGTLDSLRAQTYRNWEAILVDDGSTDDTARVVEPYLADERFRYVRQENQGIAGARNTAIRAARGEWVCFLDHDDRWLPSKLEKQVARALTTGCQIVATDAFIVEPDDSRWVYSRCFPDIVAKVERSLSDPAVDVFGILIGHNFFCTCSVMISRAMFDRHGLLDPEAAPADDLDMWLRCMPEARICFINEPLVEYVRHAGNYSKNEARMLERVIYTLRKNRRRHADDARRSRQFDEAIACAYEQLFRSLRRGGGRGAARGGRPARPEGAVPCLRRALGGARRKLDPASPAVDAPRELDGAAARPRVERLMESQAGGRLTRRPKILFVCFADSPHSQSWMSLLRDSEFDVRVFASPVESMEMFPPQPWHFPTYSLFQPRGRRVPTGEVKWLLPLSHRLRPVNNWARHRSGLAARWLGRVISKWKPDIVHTLRLNPEAGLTWRALQNAGARPKWVVTAWGQELSIEIDDPRVREEVTTALTHCDGFMSDCHRDERDAVAFGLSPSKIALKNPPPGAGGLDLGDYEGPQDGGEGRNLIVVPKTYETINHKALVIVEALRLAEDALDGYEIQLLMCSRDVQTWLRRMPESFQRRCRVRHTLPKPEFMSMLKRARALISTSLSDGTPNVMLEAMAAGALPIMSPLDSIREWIEDGHNGLLAPPLQADKIAAAIRRAATDDELWQRARRVNWDIIGERANRARVREQVLGYYRSLVS